MGYGVYEQDGRWCGYGVPAECDWPSCEKQIDRGVAYKCEEHVWYEGDDDEEGVECVEDGCGLFFCENHLWLRDGDEHDFVVPKGESDEWMAHMLTDESWEQWRRENPERVKQMEVALS